MRKTALLLLAVLLLCTACGGAREASATPASSLPGYWTAGQSFSGGRAAQGLNLTSVSAAVGGGETRISLSFVTGSSKEGGIAALNSAPAYRVDILPGPSRVRVTLALAYQDYLDSQPGPVGLFFGMYAMPGDEGETQLYFQFTGKIGLRLEEQQGALVLRIQSDDPQQEHTYMAAMAFEQAAWDIASASGMTPVLCEDGASMLLISEPFETLEQADDLALRLNEQLGAVGLNDRADTMRYRGNWAPAYRANISALELKKLGALITPQGQEIIAEPWAVNARFLCWLPDGRGLCASPLEGEEGGEQTARAEQLWAFQADGSRERFVQGDYAYVDRVAVSPDGRYVSFIERVESGRLLYVYDIADDTLEVLSSEGAGDFTAGYAWGGDGLLYALSGDEHMRLLAFDPKKFGQARIRALDQEDYSPGSVFWAEGRVYHNGGEEGKIVSMDPAGGASEVFADGDGFSISPDGQYMLINFFEENGIRVRAMQGEAEHILTQGYAFLGGCWASDGQVFSFLVSSRAGVEEQEEEEQDLQSLEYPARLYTCDPATGEYALRGILASDMIYPGLARDEIVLVAYHQREDGTLVPVTYRLSLEAL